MANGLDKVHFHGPSEDGSTFLPVDAFYDQDNKKVSIEPPLEIILEGKNVASIAFKQDGLTARYDDYELRQIGEGNSTVGINRIIGDIAMNGKLKHGDIKPLHPNLLEGHVVTRQQEQYRVFGRRLVIST